MSEFEEGEILSDEDVQEEDSPYNPLERPIAVQATTATSGAAEAMGSSALAGSPPASRTQSATNLSMVVNVGDESTMASSTMANAGDLDSCSSSQFTLQAAKSADVQGPDQSDEDDDDDLHAGLLESSSSSDSDCGFTMETPEEKKRRKRALKKKRRLQAPTNHQDLSAEPMESQGELLHMLDRFISL